MSHKALKNISFLLPVYDKWYKSTARGRGTQGSSGRVPAQDICPRGTGVCHPPSTWVCSPTPSLWGSEGGSITKAPSMKPLALGTFNLRPFHSLPNRNNRPLTGGQTRRQGHTSGSLKMALINRLYFQIKVPAHTFE